MSVVICEFFNVFFYDDELFFQRSSEQVKFQKVLFGSTLNPKIMNQTFKMHTMLVVKSDNQQ